MADRGSINDTDVNLPLCEQSRRGAIIPGLIALALVLAIGFFYINSHRHEDAPADAAIGAAVSADHGIQKVGDAARTAAEQLQKGKSEN
jgi:hypothetical protein